MKILHTSDWHLGRLFHGESLLSDQAQALDDLASVVESEQVELVIIAGDLYDRAIPPAPAMALFGQTLNRFVRAGAKVAAISGNHDSAVRVSEHDQLLNSMGVAIRGDHRRLNEPLMIHNPRDGGPPVAIYLIPYLEPAAVSEDLAMPEAVPHAAPAGAAPSELFPLDQPEPAAPAGASTGTRRHTQDRVVRAATTQIREHLAGLDGYRSVVVAHTFAAGGDVSDSERDLTVGFVDRVALSAFDGFDLVALGHLHNPQEFAHGRIAYAGSLLPYSFSEEGRPKSVRLIDMSVDGSLQTETRAINAPRPVRVLTGTLKELLTSASFNDAQNALVRVVLTDRDWPDRAKERLGARFAHVLDLRHSSTATTAHGEVLDTTTLQETAPIDLVMRFWEDLEGRAAHDDEIQLLTAALQSAGSANQ